MALKSTLFLIISLSVLSVLGQSNDSASAEVQKPKEPLRLFSFADPHQPKKASIYAAVLPGLGQVYNRKYWKVPVVYGVIGGTTWFMLSQRQIVREKNAYFRSLYAQGLEPSVYETDERDQARRYRDFGIVAMSLAYVLQIVDATVDAHFYKVDVDQNLSLDFSKNPSRFVSFNYRF